MLPGAKLPPDWTIKGVFPPYSLRQDRERGYLIFGSEEVVEAFVFEEYKRRRAVLEQAVIRAMIRHDRLRRVRG